MSSKLIFWFCMLVCSAGAQTGIIWSPTADVAPNQFGNMHPRMVSDFAGNPILIWGKNSTNQAYFSRWNGTGFSSPIVLNPPGMPVLAVSWAGPDISAHGDTVYVVFKETPEDANGIYLVHSYDGGNTFSDPVRVDAIADSISRFPTVGVDSIGNPLVGFMKFNPGWSDARYVVARSGDFGQSFASDLNASAYSGGDVCDCCPATITSRNNVVALMYRANSNNLRTSWAGISKDGGLSFTQGLEVDDTNWMVNVCPASGPDAVMVGDQLYSVFMSGAGGKVLCYRSRSNVTSLELEEVAPLTGVIAGLGNQNYPRIAASGNAAAIVWTQVVNGNSQLAIQFTNHLANGFGTDFQLLADNHVANADVVFSGDNQLYVVWEDINSGTLKYKVGTYSASSTHFADKIRPLVQVFPNPVTQNEFHLQALGISADLKEIQLTTPQGQVVPIEVLKVSDNELIVNASKLLPGVYFIRVNLNNEQIIRTLIK